MGLRGNPTYRQLRFGVELKRLRERAGLSSTEAAKQLGVNQSQLSNIEAGRTGLSTERVRRLAEICGDGSDTWIDALVEIGQDAGKGWWSDYRKVLGESHLDLAELEAGAARLYSYELLYIPGLLQTADYATAVHGGGLSQFTPEVQDRAIDFRLERQKILTGEKPARLHAIIHEAALRVLYGGREVMRDQLLRLIELSRMPNVTIQVIPLEVEESAVFGHAFMLIEPEVAELSAVLVDQLGRSHLLDDPGVITAYRDSHGGLSQLALPPVDAGSVPEARTAKDSLGLIQHILYPLL